MSTTQRNVLIMALVVVLLGVAAYFIYPPGSSTRLGLDLQGGLAVMLEAQDTAKAPRSEEGMEQAISIINRRVNGLGVTESEVQRQGEWKISVQLPGVENADQALDLIGKTAVLEFWDTSQFGAPYSSEQEALQSVNAQSADALPADAYLIHWPSEQAGVPDQWFVAKAEKPLLTGTDLESASVGIDQNNQPKVDMSFTSQGGQKFAEVTGSMAQEGQLLGEVQSLAIVLDGEVQSAPTVQERIDGGRAEITGNFTLDEAENLSLVLQTGALPVELEVVEQRSVGATLGKASLEQALKAGLIGLVLVMIFLLITYRLLGIVAIIGLVIYAVIYWGIINAVPVTMTLPSIAGAILSLGMAVDANVIIFARIKEEVREGKTVRTSVDSGFRKAVRTILDANLTTLITAVILFWAATGGVRGFALTLGIGVALSIFTEVIVSRALLGLLSNWSVFRSRTLLGLQKTSEEAA